MGEISFWAMVTFGMICAAVGYGFCLWSVLRDQLPPMTRTAAKKQPPKKPRPVTPNPSKRLGGRGRPRVRVEPVEDNTTYEGQKP